MKLVICLIVIYPFLYGFMSTTRWPLALVNPCLIIILQTAGVVTFFMKSNDEEMWGLWAKAAQQGDQKAYIQLLEQLYPYILSIIKIKINQIANSEDVTQNCLLGVHRSIHTFDSNKKFKPWLHAIIKYKIADYFSELSKKGADPLPINFEQMIDDNLSQGTPSSNEALMTILDNLPDKLKIAITLTKIQGLSYSEASKQQGITESTLRKRVSRAYKAIEEAVTEEI